MGKLYRQWTPDQDYLLPQSPRDWLPAEHLVYFVLDVVAELDLSAIDAAYQAKDPRGTQPYDPRLMTALWLYGLSQGIYSSRRIERATHEDVAFRVLAADAHPDHSRISEFRRVHHQALRGLFTQVLRLCQAAGLVKLGQVALDGTKLAANASKHRAMSYDRMGKTEAELAAEVEALLARAESADQAEDERLGVGVREVDVPAELARRETRLTRIRQAKAALEAEAQAAREAERKETEHNKEGEPEPEQQAPLPAHRVPHDDAGRPDAKAQRNFTDPDSRILKRDKTYLQGYNGQAAVAGEQQIIVAQALTNQAPDVQHLVPLTQQIERNLGQPPERLLADSGYWSAGNAGWLAEAGIDGYVATGRERKEPDPKPSGTPAGVARAEMRAKLTSPEGQAVYARRKCIVEPVFGQLREARGFKRLARRGIEQARSEWALLCTVHNLLKLFRAR
jgi:transposase